MAQRYSVDDLDELEARAQIARFGELIFAADYLAQLLDTNHVLYGFMGGFSMNIRGSDRTTTNIDIAVGGSMLQLRRMVNEAPR